MGFWVTGDHWGIVCAASSLFVFAVAPLRQMPHGACVCKTILHSRNYLPSRQWHPLGVARQLPRHYSHLTTCRRRQARCCHTKGAVGGRLNASSLYPLDYGLVTRRGLFHGSLGGRDRHNNTLFQDYAYAHATGATTAALSSSWMFLSSSFDTKRLTLAWPFQQVTAMSFTAAKHPWTSDVKAGKERGATRRARQRRRWEGGDEHS